MRNLGLLALAMWIGCGGGSNTATTQPQPLENRPEKMAEPPPPPKTDDELAVEVMDELVAVFVDAGEDCGKLAAGLDPFIDRRKGDLKRLKDYDKTLTGEKKEQWDTKTKAMTDKIMPVMVKCATDERVQASMKRLADETE